MLRRGPRSLPLLSFYDIVVLLGFLNLYGMQLVGFLNDPGLGWHLANGAQILKTGILPNTDSFLASEVVRPWIADQWFADMAMAWLYAEGGWPLLSVSFFLLYFFTFFLVHYRCLRRVTQAPLVCGLVTLCVFKMSQVQFVARPLLFGFLFFTILYSLLYRMAKGEQRWPRTLFVLPLFFIWSCIHPSFVLGIFLMGIALVGFWLDRWRGITEHQPQLGRFVMLILGCIGATFLNPYGLDLYHTILWLGGSDIRNIYSEWQPLQLRSPEGIFFSIMVATIISRLIFLRHQVRSWEILSFFGFAYAALSAVRMLP
ncbi:MAG: hypothetical protein KDD62_12215, partial [Bdellovibrionales bacterium]|nr:hypothetical protein [Bdellovibrionales bacterium]